MIQELLVSKTVHISKCFRSKNRLDKGEFVRSGISGERNDDNIMVSSVEYDGGDERAEISDKKIDEEQTDVNLSVQ